MTYGSPARRPWVLGEDDSRPFICRALELGITFFDTADMYSRGVSEEVVGRALRDFATRDQRALHLADRHGWTRFVSMQNHDNLIYREEEREMLPLCRFEGVGVIPWSPLARGFLAGNRRLEDWGDTARAKTDDDGQRLYYSTPISRSPAAWRRWRRRAA